MPSPDCLIWLRATEDGPDARFERFGLPCLNIPCVEYESLTEPSDLQLLLEWMPKAWAILPSRRTAACFARLTREQQQRFEGLACVGSKALGEIRHLNLPVRRFASVEQLAYGFESGTEMVYFSSDQVALKDLRVFEQRGHWMRYQCLFRVKSLDCREQIESALQRYEHPVWLVLAPSQAHGLNPKTIRGTLICLGRRSFETLLQRGFLNIRAAPRPNLDGLLQEVQSLLQENQCEYY